MLSSDPNRSLGGSSRSLRWDCERRFAQRGHYRAATTAAAVACGLACALLYFPVPADWMDSWKGILDLYVSLWIVLFGIAVPALWGVRALVRLGWDRGTPAPVPVPIEDDPAIGHALPRRAHANERGRRHTQPSQKLPWWWALALLAVCTAELLTHAGDRNGWIVSSQPTSGVETWTTADGYSILLDGMPAQGDGRLLLPMLSLFAGDGPPAASELDRRAGHVYLVSLLQRPLGLYWSFVAVNLLSWWVAALAVWWLGARRWPRTGVPWLASLFVATGQGFIFVGAAPAANGPALASFALVLAVCEALPIWGPLPARRVLANGAKLGWAAGAAGLIYLANVPALLFIWLYGLCRVRWRDDLLRTVAGALVATVVATALVYAWQLYAGPLLGLRFSGGNNDLVGEAARNWLVAGRRGVADLVGQLHGGSPRGILAGAFYYPWWLLAAAGYAACNRDNRRWTLAVILAGGLPAIAFSTRFTLPRVAYFMFPAIYLLAARGVDVAATWIARVYAVPWAGGLAATPAPGRGAVRPASATIAVVLTVGLVLLSNADLVGVQQLNLWFHYSQGNGW